MWRLSGRQRWSVVALMSSVGACGATDPVEIDHFEATIDGVRWQAEGTDCSYSTADHLLDVQGVRPMSGDTMRMVFLKAGPILGPATVTFGADLPAARIWDYTGYGNAHLGYTTTTTLTGTWTVLELDLEGRRCSGTFNFVGEAYAPMGGTVTPDTVTVEAGSWSCELFVN
jgi:hypothetical protein